MKRSIKTLVLAVALLASFNLATPAPTSAACSNANDPISCACETAGSASSDSTVCSTDHTKDPIAGPNGVLKKVTLMLAILAGITAVIIILVSAFKYLTANGDAQKAASARGGIIGAVVGLVIIAVSSSIILVVVGRL